MIITTIAIFANFQNVLIFRMLTAFSSRVLRRTTLILFSFSSRFGTEYFNVIVESISVLNFFGLFAFSSKGGYFYILSPYCANWLFLPPFKVV